MVFDKPITIQKIDETTEEWQDMWNVHARVNKTRGSEQTASGATQSRASLTFEVRYFKQLADIFFNTQIYRILYAGHAFNIVDYDDYMEMHKTVKLTADSYG